ncbi:MAG: hypothetical protein ACIAQF_02890, partial [Phycisphaerales bacterium JB065]
MLTALLVLSSLAATEPIADPDAWVSEIPPIESHAVRPPVAAWPAGQPIPTAQEIAARIAESDRQIEERMAGMRGSDDGCGEVSTHLEFFEAIVTLSASPDYEPTRIVYIDASAPVGGDGSSWDDAFQSVQDALVNAKHLYDTGITEFRIAGGIYRADRVAGVNTMDPDLTIEIPGLTVHFGELIGIKSLKGGYAGREAKNPDHRDIDLYPTIFTGDLFGNDDAQTFSNYDDNTKVLFVPNETELNGITIEHARIAVDELR